MFRHLPHHDKCVPILCTGRPGGGISGTPTLSEIVDFCEGEAKAQVNTGYSYDSFTS